MNFRATMKAFWNYRACFVPPLAVAAAFALLVALVLVIGKVTRVRVEFKAVAEFPTGLSIEQLHAVVGIGLSWLFSVYLFWLIAIIAGIACLYVVRQSLSDEPAAFRRTAWIVLAAAALLAAVVAAYIGHNSTLVSLQNVVKHLKLLSAGLWRLLELTNGLGIVTVVLVIVSAGICLAPAKSRRAVTRQLKDLNLLLYASAAIVVAWVLQSRLLYGFASTGLDETREFVEAIAPTVSLVVGAVASLFLILTYLSGFFVLHHRYSTLDKSTASTAQPGVREKRDDSPLALLTSTWARIIAFLVPVLPGVFEFFFNFVDKFAKLT